MPATISHTFSNTLADWSGVVTVPNSTGGSTTAQGSDLVGPGDWNATHAVTLSLTASEIASLFNFSNGLSSTTAAGGISAGVAMVPFYEPFPFYNTNSTLTSPSAGTWYLDGPFVLPEGMSKGGVNVLVSTPAGFVAIGAYSANTSGSVTYNQTFYNRMCLYTLGAGASTSRLESVWSFDLSIMATWNIALATANTTSGTVTNALTLSFPAQWNASGASTYSSTLASGSGTMNASTMVSSQYDSFVTGGVAYVSGARMDIFGMSTTLPPGVYWLGHMFTSTSSSAGTQGGVPSLRLFSTHSRLGIIEVAMGAYKQLGKSVSNSTTYPQPFHGFLATGTSSPTSIINTSDVRATTGRMYWNNFVTTL